MRSKLNSKDSGYPKTFKNSEDKNYEIIGIIEDDDDAFGLSRTVLIMADEGKDFSKKQNDSSDRGRDQWSSPVEFLLSCVSMSVGLGNVWRFPTTAYENGGGAFLIPYLLVLTLIGRPLYFMELALGQFSSSGSVKVWKVLPAFKGIGYGQMLGTWSVITYYCSLMAITIFYLVNSFVSPLPWTICNPDWADDNCVPAKFNRTTLHNITNPQSSSEQYFYNYVLRHKNSIEDGIGLPDWRLALCLLFSWVVLFFTLAKGVKSSGKVAYFTAIFPYLVLITLLVRGVTLPGSLQGIIYFIRPQWGKLLELKVWYSAVTQSFFSLGVGMGSIIMFSSYNDFKQNIYRDAWILSLADTFTSLLAGFTIFSILGYLAHSLNTDIDSVVRSSTGLAFISYPDVLAKFDFVPQLFAVLFFLMLFVLGVGSAAGFTGSIITVFCDQFPNWRKSHITAAISLIGFLMGLVYITPGGQWILELVDCFGGGLIIFSLVVVENIAINWIYGMPNLVRDIEFMLDIRLGYYWKFCWVFFIPVTLAGIYIYSLIDFSLPTIDKQPFPHVAYVFGWLLSISAILFVPFGFIHAVYVAPGATIKEKFFSTFKPKNAWGPKNTQYRQEWDKLIMKK